MASPRLQLFIVADNDTVEPSLHLDRLIVEAAHNHLLRAVGLLRVRRTIRS